MKSTANTGRIAKKECERTPQSAPAPARPRIRRRHADAGGGAPRVVPLLLPLHLLLFLVLQFYKNLKPHVGFLNLILYLFFLLNCDILYFLILSK